MAICSRCGQAAGLLNGLLGKTLCGVCGKIVAGERAQARRDFEAQVNTIVDGTAEVALLRDTLSMLYTQANFEPKQGFAIRQRVVPALAQRVLADSVLSEPEESDFLWLAGLLGTTDLQTSFPALIGDLMIARINDGRLPAVPNPKLLAKDGETVHLETVAALLKEVVVKEYRGGSSGMSFRVMKGVRYHVGSSRGRLVEVGRTMQPNDDGVLSVTNKRIVFMGRKSTTEIPYARLLHFELYTDGIRFNISNRQSAPLFRLDNAEVIAALIEANQ